MAFTRATFSSLVDDLFVLNRQHLKNDGFIAEMVMGFNTDGDNAVTFMSSAGMDRASLAELVPDGTRLLPRPLLSSGTLIAAGFALEGVRSATYCGRVYVPQMEEEYAVTVGVWPEALFAKAFASPVEAVLAEDADDAYQFSWHLPHGKELQDSLVSLEGWLVGLVPDVQIEGDYTNGHDVEHY